MSKKIIMGIQISNRRKDVLAVQQILSEHGCNIKTRLGLHAVDSKSCSPEGLIILETLGKEADILALEKKLKKIKGVVVKKMVF